MKSYKNKKINVTLVPIQIKELDSSLQFPTGVLLLDFVQS